MFRGGQEALLTALEAETGTGGLLEGASIFFSDCPKKPANAFPRISLNFAGVAELDLTYGRNKVQIEINDQVCDINVYVRSSGSLEDADRQLMDLLWSKATVPNKGLIPVLAKLAISGIQADGQRWLLLPGKRITSAVVEGQGFCVSASLQVQLRTCAEVE